MKWYGSCNGTMVAGEHIKQDARLECGNNDSSVAWEVYLLGSRFTKLITDCKFIEL